MATEVETRECPYCKEEIRADALKCKYCRSTVKPIILAHGGTCPYCKEAIKPDAIKCKHCGSMVDGSAECGCGDGNDQSNTIFYTPSTAHLFGNLGFGNPGISTIGPSPIGGDNPFLSLAGGGGASAAPASCSGCGRLSNGFSFRICCKITYIPFLGYVRVCWPEPCGGIPGDGTILT
jgi:hypothetical protein